MTVDLAVREQSVIVLPTTGELLDLRDAPAVATRLRELRDLRAKVNEATAILNDALAQHAQHIGTKTLHLEGVGKVTVTGGPGSEITWDLEILVGLLEAGLPQERYSELVQETVDYRVNASVAKQIEASGNPRYRSIVEQARGRADRPYRASLK